MGMAVRNMSVSLSFLMGWQCLDTLLPRSGSSEELLPHPKEVHEREEEREMQRVLPEAAVPHLRVMPDALQHLKGVLHLCADRRELRIPFLLRGREGTIPPPAIRNTPEERSRSRGAFVVITPVHAIPKSGVFLAVKEIGEHRTVVHVCRASTNGMDEATLGIHADVCLHAEVPLIPLLRLMHLGVVFPPRVLRARRSSDDRRIHDRSLPHEKTLLYKERVHRGEELLVEIVLFEEVPEVEDHCLIGDRIDEQINAEELLEGVPVSDGFFCGRITQSVPRMGEGEKRGLVVHGGTGEKSSPVLSRCSGSTCGVFQEVPNTGY